MTSRFGAGSTERMELPFPEMGKMAGWVSKAFGAKQLSEAGMPCSGCK